MPELSYTITTFEHRPDSYIRTKPMWYAAVEVEGNTLMFSRYDDETEWYCDAHFGANGLPHFCHGEGSRCCRKQVAAGELKAMLDERLRQEVQRCTA